MSSENEEGNDETWADTSNNSDLTREERNEFDCDDLVKNEKWLSKDKHFFVLSSAGKPIYSRYGSETKLATLFGVMQAIVSFVQHQNDSITSVKAGNTTFVFYIQCHLILVVVSKTKETVAHLSLQLKYVFKQIVSILTLTTLNKTYETRRNYDLRRSLSGVERLIDHLLDSFDTDPSIAVQGMQCLTLPLSIRDAIGSAIIQTCNKIKVKALERCILINHLRSFQNLVYAILLADTKLISLVHLKKYLLHPIDLHLIMNFVNSSESLKAAESWTPLCLPHFRDDGYLYGHVSYLADDCQACLLLLTTERDVFFPLSQAKQKIVEKLRRANCLHAIHSAMLMPPELTEKHGFAEIRHFIYKMKSTSQFYQSAAGPLYGAYNNQLHALYQRTQALLRTQSSPLKLIFEKTPHSSMLAWDTKEFELYIIFEPLVDTTAAIATVSRLLSWIKKREDRCFQMNVYTF